jgi:hypothetical protein
VLQQISALVISTLQQLHFHGDSLIKLWQGHKVFMSRLGVHTHPVMRNTAFARERTHRHVRMPAIQNAVNVHSLL